MAETLLRPLSVALVLGALLGGLGYVGFHFWENREMSPCAPVGLVENPNAALAAPASPSTLRRGVALSALGGGVAGTLAAVVFILPTALRLRRLLD